MQSEQDKCAKQDAEFLNELFQECQKMIYWTARKWTNYDDAAAEEVLQGAMVKLVKKVSTLKRMERKAQYAYIEHTVRTVALNYLHRRKLESNLFYQRDDFEEATRTVPDSGMTLEEVVEHKAYVESREKAFNMLTKAERHIMMQKYFLGLSDKEMAEKMACKPDSVRMTLSRIRKKARSYIEEGEREDI